MIMVQRKRLSLLRIVEMNIGFFGLQFSFGLQQANMTPIYKFLGADDGTMPLLWLAGPMTGLLVQPLVGAVSDRTISRLGRRTPFFLIGAIICSLCLLAMPYSPTLWAAAALLWLLDAGNNVTMEPYRAYVADRLLPDQQPAGFLTQSAFTGLAQCASYAAPSLLAALGVSTATGDGNHIPQIVKIAFLIGAVVSLASIIFSVVRVPELPMDQAELDRIAALPRGIGPALREIAGSIRGMPRAMRRLAVAMLCQWYAMFLYWQYISVSVAQSLYGTTDAANPTYLDAMLTVQQMGVAYNAVAFVSALALIRAVRRWGAPRVHALCLSASGVAMLVIAQSTAEGWMFLATVGIGLGWAGMMGNTYVMLAGAIPPERTGVYMGIFNMFIVIPMLIETLTMPILYEPLLGGDSRNALMLGGALMIVGALATLRVPRA
nr:MFS transporter [uncultured Sphingomonas sp.]